LNRAKELMAGARRHTSGVVALQKYFVGAPEWRQSRHSGGVKKSFASGWKNYQQTELIAAAEGRSGLL
jgi:hypothetical protein